MAFASASNSSLSSEVNVTPLIDVLLVLLIIFMVIGPVASRGLESALPRPGAPGAAEPSPVVVRLRSGGPDRPIRYQVGSEDVDSASLAPRLQALFARQPDQAVVVEADRGLTYQPVAEVVGLARRAGAGPVMLTATRPEAASR